MKSKSNVMNRTNLRKYMLVIVFLFITVTGFSQMMGPSDPGNGPQSGDPPIGGGAPVGSGMYFLLSLGMAYGGKKVYDLKKVNP